MIEYIFLVQTIENTTHNSNYLNSMDVDMYENKMYGGQLCSDDMKEKKV